jgi:hypothetical protein
MPGKQGDRRSSMTDDNASSPLQNGLTQPYVQTGEESEPYER